MYGAHKKIFFSISQNYVFRRQKTKVMNFQYKFNNLYFVGGILFISFLFFSSSLYFLGGGVQKVVVFFLKKYFIRNTHTVHTLPRITNIDNDHPLF